VIHCIKFASQPDLQILCDESWTTPAWSKPESTIEGTYLADSGKLYTFRDGLVTCPDCKTKMEADDG
jgi:hypothetical protein